MLKQLLLIVFIACGVHAAKIISWIPPYAADKGKAKLETARVQSGISHLALQFWVPSGSSVAKSKYEASGQFDDAMIREIRDTARAHGIKTLLCIYNGDNGWDWNLASQAMSNKTAFAKSLMTEMERLDLDGIEVDLEGPNVSGDGSVYIAFIKELSTLLRAKGKELTIASFHSEYHTPGPRHWAQLLPLVDGITTMGYAEIGMNGTTSLDASIFKPKYIDQKSFASSAPEKLMIGMLTSESQWQGNSASEQVNWVKNDGVVGIGLWDMQMQNSAWNTDAMWSTLNQIRGALVKQYEISVTSGVGGSVSPTGKVMVDSSKNQTFTITPDQYYLIEDVKVDGVSKGAVSSVTISSVKEPHTVAVTFKKDPEAPQLFVLTTKANANGSVAPSGTTTLASGAAKTVTITPAAGYVVDYVMVDNVKRGPLVKIDFNKITADHSVEAFFKKATGGDLGKYGLWESPYDFTPGDTIAHNDTLWKYQGNAGVGGWGSTMEPSVKLDYKYDPNGFGTTPWLYVGLYSGVPDTLITATMQYKSALNGGDTLVTKTDSTSGGTVFGTSTKTEILNGTAVIAAVHGTNGRGIAILRNGLAFAAPSAGTYRLAIYDLRGRELVSRNLTVTGASVVETGLDHFSLSKGVYLLRIESGLTKAVSRIER